MQLHPNMLESRKKAPKAVPSNSINSQNTKTSKIKLTYPPKKAGKKCPPMYQGRPVNKTGFPAEYRSWRAARERTLNRPAYGKFKWPKSWETFIVFFRSMGPMQDPNQTLDRIDGTKGYGPGNCQWSSPLEQTRNRACTIWLEDAGLKLTLQQWSQVHRVRYGTLYQRYRAGDRPPHLFRQVSSPSPADGEKPGARRDHKQHIWPSDHPDDIARFEHLYRNHGRPAGKTENQWLRSWAYDEMRRIGDKHGFAEGPEMDRLLAPYQQLVEDCARREADAEAERRRDLEEKRGGWRGLFE